MRKLVAICLASLTLAFVHPAHAQQAKYRVGVILEGGPFHAAVDGLKDGLKELGFQEGKDYVLEIRDLKGDRNAAEETAKRLEQGKVDLIYVVGSSVAIPAKRGTSQVPIVFAMGSDPVVAGLIESFANPGGRLTGVHYLSTDLTPKRLEILKEMLPKLRRVVMFYDPSNDVAATNAKAAREAALKLKIELVENRVASADELQTGFKAFQTQEADAYFYSGDAMVLSQAEFIINTARTKKLPTMFLEPSLVAQGALASYGVSYHEAGRLLAKYVQRVLAGTSPRHLPVDLSKFGLAVNLRTARELGITIPQSVLFRSDKVIE